MPEIVAALVRSGNTVRVQSGAGAHAFASDDAYRTAGAIVSDDVDLASTDVLAHILPLSPETISALREGAVTIGLDAPITDEERRAALVARKITALSFELLPRISRAQSMDVLSSQALVSGYRCVLEAAIRLPRFFPLAMTAAGTVPPAKVVVLGVGVAGLQAIATAKRLGAKVSANDIRTSSAEEVRSVGATFIDLGIGGEGSGGYARELAVDAATQQQNALAPYIADADVVITTASVPGRQAPRLVTAAMVAAMRPGSVVVDLAASNGGNVEGSKPGEDVLVQSTADAGTITIVGLASAPSDMPADASRLFAKNVANIFALLVGEDGGIVVNFEDEVIDGMCLAHNGELRFPKTDTAAPAAPAIDTAASAPSASDAEADNSSKEA